MKKTGKEPQYQSTTIIMSSNRSKSKSRTQSRSPVSFSFPYKDRAAYNATTVNLEEELRSDKAPNWKYKKDVSTDIAVMGPVLALIYARDYDSRLNRALITKPFTEYESPRKEASIRGHIIDYLKEPITIQQVTAALAISESFFFVPVKVQRVSNPLDVCIALQPIFTNSFPGTS